MLRRIIRMIILWAMEGELEASSKLAQQKIQASFKPAQRGIFTEPGDLEQMSISQQRDYIERKNHEYVSKNV